MSTQYDIEPSAGTSGGWRVLAPFRIREYRLLITAVAITIFAEGMWAVVMALQVIAIDNDPASLSLVATCMGVGLVAFVLVGGITADRINQRTIIIAVEAVNAVTVAVVAMLGLTGQLRIWHLAVAAAVLGIAAAFFFPAYSALLPRILPPEQLLAANGVEGVVRPVFQRAVGPAVAGMLVGATFPSLGSAVVATLFGVGLVLLVATRPPASPSVPGEHRSRVLRDLRDGFMFMVATPWLLWTLLFASVFVLVVLGPIEVLLPFIAQERFTDGARMYGFVLAAFGVGSAVGALTVSSRQMPRRYLTVMMLMWALGSVPLLVIGFTWSFLLMSAASFAIGVTDGAGMVIWGTLLQRRVPRELLGRVSSLDFFVSLVFMPVSFAIAGPLSKVVSMQTIFLVAGLAPLLFAVVAMTAARMPRDELEHPLN
ncbi:tetracycline-resistance determinant TetV [Mycolicibacterium thermoresistibile ATCC 19527]|uniref:Tetracycline-resistance determinant TetV n=2 Tax=Mycolicibacterium thermoresistibile TaxID=1797 RepID=G7CI05_MYCT3|nr:tetracycline-resistance determinant TetV [Mycolicibacterium thermoresistibile ATCC 19527]MCV7187352.1 tetracycline efflux MFS transporter Tet(V) [Mycolicibacterium thermoresistibile]GAT17209.1 major facilitator superfamily MFS_1 [Mycolicibacterium thermoresistibile]SNW19615.1 Major facilitator superfamily MFS_1 [Mycolicibacterium thermoresistibile]